MPLNKFVNASSSLLRNNYKQRKEEIIRVESSTSESDSNEFEVESIVDMKFEKGMRSFLVKWAGYPHSDNTWQEEPGLEHVIIIYSNSIHINISPV